jgi:ribonucleotide reductase beta subunit family protein with ferritin-like domain
MAVANLVRFWFKMLKSFWLPERIPLLSNKGMLI